MDESKSMKLSRPFSAAVACTILSLWSFGAAAQDQPTTGKGEQYFQAVCAKCHDTGIGPVLTGRGLPAVFFVTIARNGFNGMPAFRVSDIDDETLQDLANYLAQSKPKK